MKHYTDLSSEFTRWSITLIALLAGIIILFGCSDERSVSQLPDTHPASWMNKLSSDFHGIVVQANGTVSCTKCHGEDFDGGRVGVSCIDCHLTSGACVSCHGGVDNQTGAPPHGLRNEIDDTLLAVGAHTVHLSGTVRSAPVGCESCHLVPVSLLETYHLDFGSSPLDSVAEITWQGFADGGGATWDRSSRTCAGTYCHGNFDGGYSANSPIWTAPGQADCGSCHNDGTTPADLGLFHQIHLTTGGPLCIDCHSAVVDSSVTIVTPDLHVNGVADFSVLDQSLCDKCHGTDPQVCVYCHGGVDNQTGAPPKGLRGETSAATLAVGAHTPHIEAGYIADAFSCTECHLVPTTLTDPGHWAVDSVAEITWGALPGAGAQWDRATRVCSNIYCHGNFQGGYSNNTPNWTAPGQALCGSCHDVGSNPSDLSGRHKKHVQEENIECYECHSVTVDAGLSIIGKAVHVDGLKTVAFGSRQMIYQNGSCSGPGACHETKNW